MTRGAMLVAWLIGSSLGGAACAKRETAPPPKAAAAPAAPEPAPAPPAASCDETGASVIRAMKASIAEAKDMPAAMKAAAEAMMQRFAEVAERHCAADAWSAEARTCMATLETEKDFERCEPMLSKEQQRKLEEEMKAVMMEELGGVEESESAVATGPIDDDTGLLACNDYLRSIERFSTCDKVPQAMRDAQRQSMEAMKAGWASLRDPNVPAEARKAAADGCRTAVDALKHAAEASGCPL